jgi:hypothetical protein
MAKWLHSRGTLISKARVIRVSNQSYKTSCDLALEAYHFHIVFVNSVSQGQLRLCGRDYTKEHTLRGEVCLGRAVFGD